MKSQPVQNPSVELLVPIHGAWVSPIDRRISPTELLDHYLNPETSLDEVCAAAILVSADGKAWNSPEASEGFHHVGSWLSAVEGLVRGGKSAFIWAWEESQMTAVREDDQIILEERTHHPSFQLPPVAFELRRFARVLLDATKPGVRLNQQLAELARSRFPAEWQVQDAKTMRVEGDGAKASPRAPSQEEFAELMAQFPKAFDSVPSAWSSLLNRLFRRKAQAPVESPEGLRECRLREVIESLADDGLSKPWEQLSAALGAE